MKNKSINQNTNQNYNQNMKNEELQEPTGEGVIFIKSRKSDDKIHNMVSNIRTHAEEKDVEIVDIIVDESSGLDVDRSEVDRLWDWIENSPVGIIYLKSILISQVMKMIWKILRKGRVSWNDFSRYGSACGICPRHG